MARRAVVLRSRCCHTPQQTVMQSVYSNSEPACRPGRPLLFRFSRTRRAYGPNTGGASLQSSDRQLFHPSAGATSARHTPILCRCRCHALAQARSPHRTNLTTHHPVAPILLLGAVLGRTGPGPKAAAPTFNRLRYHCIKLPHTTAPSGPASLARNTQHPAAA